MPNEGNGAPPEAQAPPDLNESFDAAVDAAGGFPGKPGEETPAQPDAATTEASTEEQAREAEHIAWIKSISGNLNDAGEINADRVYKNFHELNKWTQGLARENAELRRTLQQNLELTSRKEPQEAPSEEPREKTDQEILDEWITTKANALIKPHVERLERINQRYVQNEIMQAGAELREHFGKVDDGKGNQVYLYDTIGSVLGNAVAIAIQQRGQPVNDQTVFELYAEMVDRGTLKSTFLNMATHLLYPQVKEQLEKTRVATKQSEIERAKSTSLPAKGAPARIVKPSNQNANWEDAVRLAEEQVGAKFQ